MTDWQRLAAVRPWPASSWARSRFTSSIAPSRKPRALPWPGAILTFFGFIHGADGLGFGQSPTLALSYLAVAGILFYCARYAEFHPVVMDVHGAAAEAD